MTTGELATLELKATAVCSEINLADIAGHFGINRKFRWEDTLVLRSQALQGILKDPENKAVYLFHFGSAVFVNCAYHEIMDVLGYLRKIEKNISLSNVKEYSDDYKIEVIPEGEPALNNDYMSVHQLEPHHLEIVAVILAKSVALEKIEISIDQLLDEVEDIVTYLNQGKLSTSDQKLAKLSARILGFKFNTLSYIMLLDKPDITWINENAETIFIELSAIFELEDRYEKIRHKSDTLLDITQVFATLTHAQRGNQLEWAIIILIAFEIVLSLYEMFFRH